MPPRVRQGYLLPEWEAATVGKPLAMLLCFSSFLVVCVWTRRSSWKLRVSVCLDHPCRRAHVRAPLCSLKQLTLPRLSLLWTCCHILSILSVSLSLATLFSWRMLAMCLPPCPSTESIFVMVVSADLSYTVQDIEPTGQEVLGCWNLCEPLRRLR